MEKNWAIAIGINKYNNLQKLEYAKRDAELVQDFFLHEAGFEQVFYFSDDSPEIIPHSGSPIPTQPTFGNLRRFLRQQFEQPMMAEGDNFWFFFSGHGLRYAERDYLMPCDADPGDVEPTAIPISYVTERLRRCGADNVVLILDACRNQGSKNGLGMGFEHPQGVISIFSCCPNEQSYEIDQLQQGSFTHALLQGLRIQGEGNCATVERLYQYLQYRVPEINRQYGKPRQTPYAIAEPITKTHLILLPQYIKPTLKDIVTLKNDALEAEVNKDFELAEQLWIRVLAVSPADMVAVRAIQRLAHLQRKRPDVAFPTDAADQDSSSKSTDTATQETTPVTAVKSTGKRVGSQTSRRSISTASNKFRWLIGTGVAACVIVGIYVVTLLNTNSNSQPPQPQKNTPSPTASSSQSAASSKTGYTQLENLLAAGKWKEADKETLAVMLKVAGREQEGWLRDEDLKKFPCLDLRAIDQLWLKYSSDTSRR